MFDYSNEFWLCKRSKLHKMQNCEGHSGRSSKNELLLTEAYNPEAYNCRKSAGFLANQSKFTS